MTLLSKITKIHTQGFRQKTECDCGPASAVMIARAFGLRRITYETLLTENYGRWLNRQAGRVRGMILVELHFAIEATFGKNFEVKMRRAFPENIEVFKEDLLRAKTENLGIIINFNQDYLFERYYKSDQTAFTHYSPIMDFDKNERVTIADVDPKLKSAYTVPADQVFKSMSQPHNIFRIPRGWITIRKRISS